MYRSARPFKQFEVRERIFEELLHAVVGVFGGDVLFVVVSGLVIKILAEFEGLIRIGQKKK
jgi:hypothetical protein